MSENYAMGKVFIVEDAKEKLNRCSNFWCRTKLTQNEIEENGGRCNACAIMETQRHVIAEIDHNDHCEGDID